MPCTVSASSTAASKPSTASAPTHRHSPVEQHVRQAAHQQGVDAERDGAQAEHVKVAARDQQDAGDGQQAQSGPVRRCELAAEQGTDGRARDKDGGEHQAQAQGPVARARPARQQGRDKRTGKQHGQPAADENGQIGRIDAPAMACMGLHPQGGGRGQHQHPRRPQHVAARHQAQGQGQHGPQGEQLPRIGARLVGLAEIREQAADSQQGQQQQGHARLGHGKCAHASGGKHPLQQGKAAHAAQLFPVGGNPADQSHAQQRDAQHCHAARQPVGQARRFALEAGHLLQLPGLLGIERVGRGELVHGEA